MSRPATKTLKLLSVTYSIYGYKKSCGHTNGFQYTPTSTSKTFFSLRAIRLFSTAIQCPIIVKTTIFIQKQQKRTETNNNEICGGIEKLVVAEKNVGNMVVGKWILMVCVYCGFSKKWGCWNCNRK